MTVETEIPDEHTAVVRVTTALTPQQAFDAFADTARFASWFWPERFETRYDGSLTSGGTLHAVSDVLGMGVTFVVTGFEAGARIDCDWRWDGSDDVTTVRIEVTDGDTGTVTVTHGANATAVTRDEHLAGWRSCLERLETYVA